MATAKLHAQVAAMAETLRAMQEQHEEQQEPLAEMWELHEQVKAQQEQEHHAPPSHRKSGASSNSSGHAMPNGEIYDPAGRIAIKHHHGESLDMMQKLSSTQSEDGGNVTGTSSVGEEEAYDDDHAVHPKVQLHDAARVHSPMPDYGVAFRGCECVHSFIEHRVGLVSEYEHVASSF